MKRSEVLNQLLTLYPSPRYLEVGVDSGVTFFAVDAPDKSAVDPHFKFAVPQEHPTSKFYPVESDVYFADSAAGAFDVTFLDGLHTFEQILKDFISSVRFRSRAGVIVIDDVIPNSYAAALPDLDLNVQFRIRTGSTDGSWMGDVYKIVPFIHSYFPEFSYATVLENHGQLVLWPEQRTAADSKVRSVEAIARLDYAQVTLENPYRIQPFEEIFARVKRAVDALA